MRTAFRFENITPSKTATIKTCDEPPHCTESAKRTRWQPHVEAVTTFRGDDCDSQPAIDMGTSTTPPQRKRERESLSRLVVSQEATCTECAGVEEQSPAIIRSTPSLSPSLVTPAHHGPEPRSIMMHEVIDVDESSSSCDGSQDAIHASTSAPEAPTLSVEQEFIRDMVVQHRRSVFLTGGAGTGKSFLLREILNHLDKRTTFVTAPTGIAALNIGGTTIHRFAGVQKGEGTRKELLSMVRGNRAACTSWKQCRVLVIDEVSMLSAALLDSLEYIARRIRGRQEPFGGIQLVLCGDFLQLPPVKRANRPVSDEDGFCFLSRAWSRINPRVFVLRTVFRQQDSAFATILNELRVGDLSSDSLMTMMAISHHTRVAFVEAAPHQRIIDAEGSTVGDRLEGKTVLRSTNSVVADINSRQFKGLTTPIWVFDAADIGPRQDMLQQCAAEDCVELRVGCRVMLLKNIDVQLGLVNGSIGTLARFVRLDELNIEDIAIASREKIRLIAKRNSEGVAFPVVRFTIRRYDGSRSLRSVERELLVEPQSWTVESGSQLLATRWQIPLKLAWAITIHKSQGMTLSDVNVDFDGMFEDGQAYVALSRCATLEGLTVENFDVRRVRTNLVALAYYQKIEEDIQAAGGDATMYVAPTMAENCWGLTQDDAFEDDNDDEEWNIATRKPQRENVDCTPTALSQALNALVTKLRVHAPPSLLATADDSTVLLTAPHSFYSHKQLQVCTAAVPVRRKLSQLYIPLEVVSSFFVVVDTCSWIADHSAGGEHLRSLTHRNFVRVPQQVLVELDGLIKHQVRETAHGARKARNIIASLVNEFVIELQRSDESLLPAEVFALGGECTGPHGSSSEADNSILCFAAYLRKSHGAPVAVCTEDGILGLRARACGFACTSVCGH